MKEEKIREIIRDEVKKSFEVKEKKSIEELMSDFMPPGRMKNLFSLEREILFAPVKKWEEFQEATIARIDKFGKKEINSRKEMEKLFDKFEFLIEHTDLYKESASFLSYKILNLKRETLGE
jgi:hypothetical protein